MTARSEDRGVLFVDISNSSRVYNELGNEGARRVVVQTLDLLAVTVEAHGGTVIDRIGDELMCIFPNAPVTATAAIELQRTLRDAVFAAELPGYLSVRIGFHFGAILRDGKRIFGDAVYVARRMATLAKAHQILTTGDTVEVAIAADQLVRSVDWTRIKGKQEMFRVYEVVWDPDTATVAGFADSWSVPRRRAPELKVSYGHDEFLVDSNWPRVTIGRDATCDIRVNDPRISRLHARIEFRKTHYYLTDTSTNGTFVVEAASQTPIRLHRRARRLQGNGSILLTPPGEGTEIVLEYRTDPFDDFVNNDGVSQEIG